MALGHEQVLAQVVRPRRKVEGGLDGVQIGLIVCAAARVCGRVVCGGVVCARLCVGGGGGRSVGQAQLFHLIGQTNEQLDEQFGVVVEQLDGACRRRRRCCFCCRCCSCCCCCGGGGQRRRRSEQVGRRNDE